MIVEKSSMRCFVWPGQVVNGDICQSVFPSGKLFTQCFDVGETTAFGKMGLPDWVKSTFGRILQTVLRPVGVKGFVILPKRWIVERSFAWISKYRRNSKDYERKPESSKAMIYIAMTNRMLNYLKYRKFDV